MRQQYQPDISLQAVSAYIHTQKIPRWDFIPNPENSKPPGLTVGRFFGGALLQALWFYVTAVTAVTMFYTFYNPILKGKDQSRMWENNGEYSEEDDDGNYN